MMKLTLILSVVLLISCQAANTSEKATPAATSAASEVKPEEKKEDCADKAKKVVEIKPESISLGTNTGCSLDEANKKDGLDLKK
jgi:hypothetical protein